MKAPVVIIGAGPTGLGAAWRLDTAGRPDWVLLEGEEAAGGLARSVVDEHGFTWDLGGHVQFSHYQVFDRMMDELLGADGWLYHERESWVRLLDRFVPYPFQLNLHRLPDAERDACLAGLDEAAAAAGGTAPAHFGDWIDATFGRGIAELFMRPYNRKVWARAPERMDWRWIGDRVAVVDRARVRENIRLHRDDVSWGPNRSFRFPKQGGTGAVWRALAARLDRQRPGRIRYRTRVARIDTAAHRVYLEDGSAVAYDRLLSTMPIDALVAMAGLDPDLREAASRLEYSSTHVVGVGLHGQAPAALADKCWMYFPEANCPFYRVTHFSKYSPQNVPDPSRQWSLMAEVAESAWSPVDPARVAPETVRGMVASGLIPDETHVHHTWVMRLDHGYPVPALGRDEALARLLPALEARDVFSRGRFGAWKYEVSNQDHSFAQGIEVVDRWLGAGEEVTLHHPERVNAPAPREARA